MSSEWKAGMSIGCCKYRSRYQPDLVAHLATTHKFEPPPIDFRSYHGWQFGPGGRCAAIPQADSPQQAAFACGNLRSCVAAYPVREQDGMLWVWMDPYPASAPTRQRRPLPMPAELAAAEAAAGGAPKPSVMLGSW